MRRVTPTSTALERLPVPRAAVVALGLVSLACGTALATNGGVAAPAIVAVVVTALMWSSWSRTRLGLVALTLPVHAFVAVCWTGVAEADPCIDAGYSTDHSRWEWLSPRDVCAVPAADGTTSVVAESWWVTSTFVCGVVVTALLVAPGRPWIRAVAAVGVCLATVAIQFS